jgi:hypothetical protein
MDEQPIPNLKVVIGGATATTDTSGHFTIPNVTVPYDVLLVHVPANGLLSGVYKGLTRTDPKLLSFGSIGSTINQSGTLSGNVTGGDPLTNPNDTTAVLFASPEALSPKVRVSVNPFILDLIWLGPAATTGNLHALQWSQDVNGVPVAYSGYGVTTGVAVANGGSTQANVTMSSVATTTIAGSVSAPDGGTAPGRLLAIDFSDGASFTVGGDSTPATSFSFLVPAGIDSTASIIAGVNLGTQGTSSVRVAGIQPGTMNAVVTIPAPAIQLTPGVGAVGVTTATDFGFTTVPNAVQVVFFNSVGNPNYYVVTTGNTARIPDLSAMGEPLPGSTPYAWTIQAVGPASSMDGFAEGNPLFARAASFIQTLCPPRSFTTQ